MCGRAVILFSPNIAVEEPQHQLHIHGVLGVCGLMDPGNVLRSTQILEGQEQDVEGILILDPTCDKLIAQLRQRPVINIQEALQNMVCLKTA